MPTVAQLAFDFTRPVERSTDARQGVPWQVPAIAKRYRLPIALASVYAREMGCPVGEVRA